MQPVKIKKDYSWKIYIYEDTVKACETGLVPDVKVPKHINPVKPVVESNAELLAKFRSRMGRKVV